jgi:hypothetical protein
MWKRIRFRAQARKVPPTTHSDPNHRAVLPSSSSSGGIIRKRVNVGLARAKEGHKVGSTPFRPSFEARILELRNDGHGIHRIRKTWDSAPASFNGSSIRPLGKNSNPVLEPRRRAKPKSPRAAAIEKSRSGDHRAASFRDYRHGAVSVALVGRGRRAG